MSLAAMYDKTPQPAAPSAAADTQAPAAEVAKTEEQLAALFHDHPKSKAAEVPADAPPAQRVQDGMKPAADKVFGKPEAVAIEVPEAVAKLRGDAEKRMYEPGDAFNSVVSEDDFPDPDMPAEVKSAVVGEYRRIFDDLGVSSVEAGEVVGLVKAAEAELPTEEIELGWIAESAKRLVEMNGSIEEANKALDLAKQLVARDPRVAAVLERTGLGSHPKVVMLLAAQARSEKLRGRL